MYKLENRIDNIKSIYTSSNNQIIVDKEDSFYLNGFKSSSYKSILR